jgi:hypothetical protein
MILIVFLLSRNTIEKFTDAEEITPITIYNITCGNTNNNLDLLCNIYNKQKNLISKFDHDYNSARRNTENKYYLWDFSKNEVAFKKAVLDAAILLNSKLNIRNKIEKTLKIINAVVAAKKITIILNSGYTPSTVAYKNALDEYNKIVANDNGDEKILEINDKDGYSSAFVALDKTIEKYNNAVFIAIATNTSKSKNLTPSISKTTEIEDLINAQTIANDAYSEINDKYIISSLNTYNQAAKDAQMKEYEITDNLLSIQINAENSYENSQKSEKTKIELLLSNYNIT